MKRAQLRCLIAAAALAAAPAFASGDDQPIDVYTDGLPSHIAQQVQEHAARGEQALMQYLWFTRRSNHLWLDDVTKPRKAEAVAQDESQEKKHVAYEMHPHGYR